MSASDQPFVSRHDPAPYSPTPPGIPSIPIDLARILRHYLKRYAGAMCSGCGCGYLLPVADEPVPASMRLNVRIA